VYRNRSHCGTELCYHPPTKQILLPHNYLPSMWITRFGAQRVHLIVCLQKNIIWAKCSMYVWIRQARIELSYCQIHSLVGGKFRKICRVAVFFETDSLVPRSLICEMASEVANSCWHWQEVRMIDLLQWRSGGTGTKLIRHCHSHPFAVVLLLFDLVDCREGHRLTSLLEFC
jgi:hypothetical protein